MLLFNPLDVMQAACCRCALPPTMLLLFFLSFQSPRPPNLPPQFQLTLAIFSNIGAAISLLCLILLAVTYIASK